MREDWLIETADAYRRLGLAIILSGVRDRDVAFLASDWCRELCRLCDLSFDGKALLQAVLRGGWWRMSNWQAVERELGRRLKGQRTGNTGKAAPDVVSDWLSVEVKSWRQFPKWLVKALAQARQGCVTGTKLPIVVLHTHGEHHDGDLVIMTLRDFTDWFGEIKGIRIPKKPKSGLLGLCSAK